MALYDDLVYSPPSSGNMTKERPSPFDTKFWAMSAVAPESLNGSWIMESGEAKQTTMSDDDVTFHLPVKDPIPTENQVFVTMTQEESAKVEAIREELKKRIPSKSGSNSPRC